MHFHLPKPLHGWREFTGEVGIIVVGVLIALGAEQVVEAIHHRSQVNEVSERLRAESLDNQRLLDYDLVHLRRSSEAANMDLAAIAGCRSPGAIPALKSLPQDTIFTPVDVAWQGARDSALLPLMPPLQVDNYAKVDGIMTGFATRTFDLRRDLDRTSGAVESLRAGARDREVCDAALLALNELRQTELNLILHATFLRAANQRALTGERIDVDVKSLAP